MSFLYSRMLKHVIESIWTNLTCLGSPFYLHQALGPDQNCSFVLSGVTSVLKFCFFLFWRTRSFLMWSQRVRWSRSWSSLSTWWIQVTESCWTIQTPFSTSTWLTTCRTRWGHLLCGLDHVGRNHSFWHFLCWRLPLGHTSVRPDSKEAYIAGSKGHDQRKGDYPQCSSSEGFLLRWTQSRVEIWSPSVLFNH